MKAILLINPKKINEVLMIKLSPHNGFVLVDSLLGLLLTTISLAILLLIFTSSKTFGVNNSQTQLYQLATSYGEALQTINITEILRQYFINHPQSIDKYTFLQNSAFTHWVKEKCSKMC